MQALLWVTAMFEVDGITYSVCIKAEETVWIGYDFALLALYILALILSLAGQAGQI